MSLATLLATVEKDASALDPTAFARAALRDIECLKADGAALRTDLEDIKLVLAKATPTITAVLDAVYPNAAGIPTEVVDFLSMLEKYLPPPVPASL